MKRILALFFLLFLVTPALAANLFTTTVMDTTVQEVQDVILEIMTRENFTIDEVDENKVVVGKQGAPMLFAPPVFSRVKFNMLPRDGNIKLLVTQVDSAGSQSQQRSIDHLIPLIREIRNRIDGTPREKISNETVTAAGGTGGQKALGIRLGEKNGEGYIVIARVETGSKAAEAGLAAGDILVEVNGRSAKEFQVKDLQSYLETKWSQKASILAVYSREGKTNLAAIKD